MQKLITLIFFLAAFANGQAQNLTDREIESLLKELVVKIKSNPKIKNAAVSDFTDLDGVPTRLGKYLAEEFSYILSNIDGSVQVIDRSRLKVLFQEAGLDSVGLLSPETSVRLGKIKGIDSVIYGVVTEAGDEIRVIVRLVSVETSAILAIARGNITINSTIRSAMGESPKPGVPKPVKTVAVDPLIKSGQNLPFRKDDLTFELTGCRQSGSSLECFLDVKNNGKEDLDLIVYGNNSRAINLENGYEYKVATLKMADNINNYEVQKTLVAGSKLKSVFTFADVRSRVAGLSKLEIHCWTRTSTNFEVEFRNISIQP